MLIKLTKLKKVMLLNENCSSNFHKKRKQIGLRYHFWKKNLESLPHYRGIHVKFTFKKFSMRKWRGTCFFMNMLLQRLSAGLTMTIVPIFARYQSFNKVSSPISQFSNNVPVSVYLGVFVLYMYRYCKVRYCWPFSFRFSFTLLIAILNHCKIYVIFVVIFQKPIVK